MIIHPFATVHPNCEIGEGAHVWQGASVIRGAKIGPFTTIGGCAIVDASWVGSRSAVGHGAQIHPGARIGDEVFIGPGAIICNDPWPRVRKGDFDLKAIMAGAVIVRIGSGASIGCNAVVLPGVTIGEDAMVAASTVVDRDVPALHIFKRDGRIVEISRRQITRMRLAAEIRC